MGSPSWKWTGDDDSAQERIDRTFAIAAKEVTVEQFLRFRKDYEFDKDYARTAICR